VANTATACRVAVLLTGGHVARTPEQHSDDSRFAAHTMWAGVTDPAERLRNAHDNSPRGYVWHARRLLGR